MNNYAEPSTGELFEHSHYPGWLGIFIRSALHAACGMWIGFGQERFSNSWRRRRGAPISIANCVEPSC
ncbi:hypothetical protein ACWGS9_33315 [Bradyrhizobium sp. Arg314]